MFFKKVVKEPEGPDLLAMLSEDCGLILRAQGEFDGAGEGTTRSENYCGCQAKRNPWVWEVLWGFFKSNL